MCWPWRRDLQASDYHLIRPFETQVIVELLLETVSTIKRSPRHNLKYQVLLNHSNLRPNILHLPLKLLTLIQHP
jgi:hypothetical protein